MSTSKREQIVESLFSLLKSRSCFDWKLSSREPFVTVRGVDCPALSVFDYQEDPVAASQSRELVELRLLVVVEFWVQVKPTEVTSTKLNSVLDSIREQLQPQFLSLAPRKIRELGNKFSIESANEKIATGSVLVEILYFDKR